MNEPEPQENDEEYEIVDTYQGKDTVIYYDTEEEQHVIILEK